MVITSIIQLLFQLYSSCGRPFPCRCFLYYRVTSLLQSEMSSMPRLEIGYQSASFSAHENFIYSRQTIGSYRGQIRLSVTVSRCGHRLLQYVACDLTL